MPTEQTGALGWYHQRLSREKDPAASAIMRDAVKGKFKHFGMSLEFLLRKTPEWRQILQGILFKQGDIVGHADSAEEKSG